MTNDDATTPLPGADELPHRDEFPHDDEERLVEDATDEAAAAGREEGQEDLSTDDLIQDGALPEDLERPQGGRREYEADLADPAHQDTIDERVRQEQPEEGFDVVPGSPADGEPA